MRRDTTEHMKIMRTGTHTAFAGQGFSGNAAALRAGCRLADPADVDHAACAAALKFLARPRTRKASGEMRAILLPYVQAAQS